MHMYHPHMCASIHVNTPPNTHTIFMCKKQKLQREKWTMNGEWIGHKCFAKLDHGLGTWKATRGHKGTGSGKDPGRPWDPTSS